MSFRTKRSLPRLRKHPLFTLPGAYFINDTG